jgi:predicted Zn-dependent peptidase
VLAPDYFAARFFCDIVGGGASSRLFQQVREERGLAYSVYAQMAPYSDVSLFTVYAATARRESAAAAQLIDDVLNDAAATATPASWSGCARKAVPAC